MVFSCIVGTPLTHLCPLVARAPESSSIGSTTKPILHAPPLVVANIVVYSLLLAAVVVLFGFTLRALFYTRTRTIAVGAVVALIVAIIAYSLEIADLVISAKILGAQSSIIGTLYQIRSATVFFTSLKDPTLFAVIALVIQNRFRSVNSSPLGVNAFTCIACFILVAMTVFVFAGAGLYASAYAEIRKFTFGVFEHRLLTSTILFYVATAFQILGTIFLTISAVPLKARTRGDQIMSLTLFVIIPLLSLYSIAELLFDVIIARLPFPSSLAGAVQRVNATNLSTTIVYGVLHTAIMSAVVYLISRRRLWNSQYAGREGTPLTPGEHVTEDPSQA